MLTLASRSEIPINKPSIGNIVVLTPYTKSVEEYPLEFPNRPIALIQLKMTSIEIIENVCFSNPLRVKNENRKLNTINIKIISLDILNIVLSKNTAIVP